MTSSVFIMCKSFHPWLYLKNHIYISVSTFYTHFPEFPSMYCMLLSMYFQVSFIFLNDVQVSVYVNLFVYVQTLYSISSFSICICKHSFLSHNIIIWPVCFYPCKNLLHFHLYPNDPYIYFCFRIPSIPRYCIPSVSCFYPKILHPVSILLAAIVLSLVISLYHFLFE